MRRHSQWIIISFIVICRGWCLFDFWTCMQSKRVSLLRLLVHPQVNVKPSTCIGSHDLHALEVLRTLYCMRSVRMIDGTHKQHFMQMPKCDNRWESRPKKKSHFFLVRDNPENCLQFRYYLSVECWLQIFWHVTWWSDGTKSSVGRIYFQRSVSFHKIQFW